jgi:hypothetical protein
MTIAISAAALSTAACGEVQRRPDERAATVREQRTTLLTALASRHGADVDWQKPFDQPGFRGYTAALQKALLGDGSKPVIITGYLNDIVRLDDGRYQIHGSDDLVRRFDLYLSLIGTAMIVEPHLAGSAVGNRYAFVARVSRIWKPRLEALAETEDDSPLLLVQAGRVVLLDGECLEILQLPR